MLQRVPSCCLTNSQTYGGPEVTVGGNTPTGHRKRYKICVLKSESLLRFYVKFCIRYFAIIKYTVHWFG